MREGLASRMSGGTQTSLLRKVDLHPLTRNQGPRRFTAWYRALEVLCFEDSDGGCDVTDTASGRVEASVCDGEDVRNTQLPNASASEAAGKDSV